MLQIKMMFGFKKLTLQDCPLLHNWLQLDHVMKFWDDGDRKLEQTINHYIKMDEIKRYLFSIHDTALGYIQAYPINNTHLYARFIDLPKQQETIGIDFFIGNPDYLGKRLSHLILEEFINQHYVSAQIVVDPLINNYKSISAYKKAGFDEVSCFVENAKQYVLMIRPSSK